MTLDKHIKLYHASLEEVVHPDPAHGRSNADFGQGFYLTTDKEFALRWAAEGFVINEYDLDTEGLVIHQFVQDAGWFDYIFQNRRHRDTLAADVIIGPIANDTLYDTFGVITSGYLQAGEALKLLGIGPQYTQAAVKSERTARQLKWLGAQAIPDIEHYRALRLKEEEAYQEEFFREFEKL